MAIMSINENVHAFETTRLRSSWSSRPRGFEQSISAHGPMLICIVASAHELVIQIHDVLSAHKRATQIGR